MTDAPEPTVIYPAQAIHTMDPALAAASAVAVADGRIVGVGSVEELMAAAPDSTIDRTFAERVVLPGLIDQHLHPFLAATTLATEVIAPEAWHLPGITFAAAADPAAYDAAMSTALSRTASVTYPDPEDDWLLSWGYHGLWHGEMNRQRLDALSGDRPVGIWQRSCHEWYLNSAGIERLGLTADWLAGKGPDGEMVDLETGRAWEGGLFNVLFPKLTPILVSPRRVRFGLEQMVSYLHGNGVTAFNEPGLIWGAEPVDLYQEILGDDDVPFLSTFMVDGRSQAARGIPAEDAPTAGAEIAERLPTVAESKVAMFRDQVKLFADGAIISQLMVMADPYLDEAGQPDPDHHGEWLMSPDVLRDYFSAYWNAGWQIHTHVNGDGALGVLLDIIAECQAANPRTDHRCVIVHFANSTEAQVARIAELGCLVSANPYYPVGFADRYGDRGLGSERADAMVRAASVLTNGIGLSLHSDCPMAPADPMFLAACAVNRTTPSGRVAGPEQRISVHDALRAVTIEAAHSWRMEDEIGSITVGKRATFTVFDDDPYEREPAELATTPIVGTMFEGRWFPLDQPAAGATSLHGEASQCSCHIARALADAVGRSHRTAA